MKFSEFWLREWVNLAIDSNTLADQMTMAGLEVNSIEPVAGNFTGVVIGKIVECRPHINNDKLFITTVDIGDKILHNIACEAKNCRKNLIVAVATTGAVLPVTFKKSNFVSEGILCSFPTLGIEGNNNYIIELPEDAPIGKDIREYLQLEDNILDINITPNRTDCLGLLGIAREISVFNRINLKKTINNTVLPVINDKIFIGVDVADACPRYLGRIVKNININIRTPLWMKEKLRRCGYQSIDAIIDITNYVLLELGQPTHIFDFDSIESGILVRYARKNELLTLVNGSNITLTSDTLVIADYSKVLSIAGIIVGANSCINYSSTCNLFLECAFFNPLIITGAARRYKLRTNTLHRYERGVDPTMQQLAIERVTELLVAICGGQPGPVMDITSKIIQSNTIILHRKKLDRIIGHIIKNDDVNDLLTRIGCKVRRYTKEDYWQVTAPIWRFDISIEEDLIEEIARLYGYNMIPSVPVRANLTISPSSESLQLARVKMLLVDRGYQETIIYSFVDPKKQALFHPYQVPLVLQSPISSNRSVMRLSLWTGLIDTLIYNQNRQQQRIRLFESGFCFIPDNKNEIGIRQDFMFAGVITGTLFNEYWDKEQKLVDFYDIKGDIEAIFDILGKLEDIEFRVQQHPALHPGQSAAIYFQKEFIGFIGVIHPEIEAKLNLKSRTLVFEFLWDKVIKCKVHKIIDISKFPANRRDIAIVVSDNVAVADIINECKKVIGNQLVNITIFDIWYGIKKGFKSIAISLILQNKNHTLEEKEITDIIDKCIFYLKIKFNAYLRNENSIKLLNKNTSLLIHKY
ncbi:Phenylalanine--tRNA ligase beta subunit [secondary endosymbiont of Trabutina mannipara]|uniref:Phenylalanine--tRNA ligase beta subunit n=1 Tax=secondary endosymbiont of Trabutina mannipara TaxID=1835721 RepID=A0A1C3L408_9ENTR|nr:phenylalanine--tRNA ligase subunit beta [secondary endosymbiont of Trabutina mannipara]SBT81995.1 Phenylalanine--tRNA ligase beta subunit [secondary endosymbiont of Trabutina mannipara]